MIDTNSAGRELVLTLQNCHGYDAARLPMGMTVDAAPPAPAAAPPEPAPAPSGPTWRELDHAYLAHHLQCTALLALAEGDSVALSGSLTPKTWTDKEGNTRPALDLVAHQVLTAYAVTRKRNAMGQAQQQTFTSCCPTPGTAHA